MVLRGVVFTSRMRLGAGIVAALVAFAVLVRHVSQRGPLVSVKRREMYDTSAWLYNVHAWDDHEEDAVMYKGEVAEASLAWMARHDSKSAAAAQGTAEDAGSQVLDGGDDSFLDSTARCLQTCPECEFWLYDRPTSRSLARASVYVSTAPRDVDAGMEHKYREFATCCATHNDEYGLRALLSFVIGVLGEEGVRYWLEGQTLLAQARYKHLHPWQVRQAAVVIYEDDHDKFVKNVVPRIERDEDFVWAPCESQMFKWFGPCTGSYTVRHRHSVGDVHVSLFRQKLVTNRLVPVEYSWRRKRENLVVRPEWIFPLERCVMLGLNARCPRETEEYIEHFMDKVFGATPEVEAYHRAIVATEERPARYWMKAFDIYEESKAGHKGRD